MTAQQLLKDGKKREALKVIRDQLQSDALTPDEHQLLLRMAAQLEVELGNIRQGIRDLEATIPRTTVPDEASFIVYFRLGRLYLAVEPPDYGKAIENLNTYIEVADKPDPDAFFYLGQALALTDRCKEAIPQVIEAIELTEKPKERYQRLLLFCHTELGAHAEVVSLTERMIERFGAKDEYMTALAEAQRALGREEDAFLTEAQRYELGFLTEEAEIIRLAERYLEHGNPHRAARILDKEMKAGRVKRTAENLEKLGNLWFLAREYEEARESLAEAARLKSPGTADCDFRTGCHPYFDESPEAWKEREQKLRRALKEGKLREPCHAHILLAHTLYAQDKNVEALKQFEKAAKSKACAEEARQWIEYLELREDVRRRVTTFSPFMSDLIRHLKVSLVTLSEDENIRAIAEEALQSARAALAAGSEETRDLKLAEYERARDAALRHLNAGALDKARQDRAEVEKIRVRARQADLTAAQRKLLQRLDESSKRRVEALEQAQADLKTAAEIAGEARAKLTSAPPRGEAGH